MLFIGTLSHDNVVIATILFIRTTPHTHDRAHRARLLFYIEKYHTPTVFTISRSLRLQHPVDGHRIYNALHPEENGNATVEIKTRNGELSSWPLTYTVCILNKRRGGELLLAIPCRPHGRSWNHVLLFLKSVCGDFDIRNYSLSIGNDSAIVLSDDLQLPPAEYTISPINDSHPVLNIIFEPLPIIPRGALSGSTTAIKDHSRRPQKRPRFDYDIEKLVAESANAYGRDLSFSKRIIQRDQHCIVTRDYSSLKAYHIVDRAWWMDHPERRGRLPEDIKAIIRCLGGGVEHITNGILLNASIAEAFDRGHISFRFSEGHYYVVAITSEFDSIDGIRVDENLRPRCDGTVWWAVENRPNPYLMAFHLRNSVFARCRGADAERSCVEVDERDLEIARNLVSEFFENSEIGMQIASSLTLEVLAQIDRT